jgi:hypothetical protein
MLLLCKPVRDSEKKCSPIAKKNQDKKAGNILKYGVEELGPMGRPLAGPLTVLLLLLLLGPCVINLLPRFIRNRMDTVKLQLVRQYQRLPLDDFPEMVIRDYDGEEKGMIRKPRERSKLGKNQRRVKPFPLARAPASSYLARNCGWPLFTAVLT